MFTSAIEVTAIKPMSANNLITLSPIENRLRATPVDPLPPDTPRKRRASPHGSIWALYGMWTGEVGTSIGSDGSRSYVCTVIGACSTA
jgi:hypothetical protein